MYNSNKVVPVLLNSTYEVMIMYVVKVFHGYIDKTGHRTRDKIGGHVKRLEEVKV